MQSKIFTEQRLEDALNRLLENKPEHVKRGGRITLNKINNEAGLGNSYIHKFPDFVKRVKPIIEEYNSNPNKPTSGSISTPTDDDEVAKLKLQLKKERELKVQYRNERDEAITAQKELEKHNSALMFRLFELQEEVRANNIVSISS